MLPHQLQVDLGPERAQPGFVDLDAGLKEVPFETEEDDAGVEQCFTEISYIAQIAATVLYAERGLSEIVANGAAVGEFPVSDAGVAAADEDFACGQL